MVLFAFLGALMLVLKLAFEFIPNVHFLGTLTIVYTLVFRKKALIPIYVYVFLNGLWGGFSMWWLPYTYIWTLLWGAVMLLPQKIPAKVGAFLYPVICALHGLLFGTLYAPAQAIMFGLDWNEMLLWIAAGLPWDAVHAVGNLVTGLLILPLSRVLGRLYRKVGQCTI